jgi:HEAT repeat protein
MVKAVRALSEQTRDRLVQLYRKVPAVRRLLGGSDDQCRLLFEIGSSGETAALVYVAPFLRTERTRAAATSAVAALVSKLGPLDLPKLEEIRGFSFDWPDEAGVFSKWLQAETGLVGALDDGTPDSLWVMGFLSFHWNGFLREEAVRRLAARQEIDRVPFLLLRANDWVSQVRKRAKQALLVAIKAHGADAFGAFLPLVERLSATRREDHEQLLSAIGGLFAGSEGQRVLRRAICSPDRYVRRSAYARGWESGDSDVGGFLEGACADSDSVVRSGAVQRACQLADGHDRRTWLRRFLGDKFSCVRRIALYGWVEHFADGVLDDAFLALLADRSAGIRDAARFYVKRASKFDFVGHYRERFTSRQVALRTAALIGFGETAQRRQLSEIVPFLSDSSARVRAAAMTAAGKLTESSETASFVTGLQDESPAVSKAARLVLERRRPSVAELREHLYSDVPDHTRINILKILAARNRRGDIYELAGAASRLHEGPRDWATKAVYRWVDQNRRWPYAPPRETCERLEQVIEEHGPNLGELRTVLQRLLNEWASLPRFSDW